MDGQDVDMILTDNPVYDPKIPFDKFSYFRPVYFGDNLSCIQMIFQ
ncbi:MAG: hypothetical protein R6U64_09950 [Bacteroidales bacterium]